MEELAQLPDIEFLDNTLRLWLIALGIAVASTIVMMLVRRIARNRLAKIAPRTATSIDDLVVVLLKRTMGWFLILLGLFLGSLVLGLAEGVRTIAVRVMVIATVLQAGRWAGAAVQFYLERFRTSAVERDPSSLATLNILRFVGLTLVWALVILLVLDNLGFDVTTLLAGLGIGGVAVALAAQKVLGDLFASLSIALDKPFAVRDFLIVGDFLGTVENIGIKTTRLRSLSGEQLVFSNTDLLDSRIRNYGRMRERRIPFTVGVTYQTPKAQLECIPALLKAAVESQGDKVRFDRAHFKGYGAFSLDFEIVYYVLSPDYNAYMDVQQAINLEIFEVFEKDGIEFAYPTQTLFISGLEAGQDADNGAEESRPPTGD